MTQYIAAFPMYDWPETRAETDAEWAGLRDLLRARGVDAPERLARRHGDLPAVPDGIRDAAGKAIAVDPAALPPEELDLAVLWRHPKLLLAQACWGPLECGLTDHVHVLWQPSYDGYEGGEGTLYSSAVVMRKREAGAAAGKPTGPAEALPLQLLTGPRFAFNSLDSMSGYLALARDLEAAGVGLEIFSGMIETGSHRSSLLAVAQGSADLAAIDCRTWAMFRRHDLRAVEIEVVAWTRKRPGLPLIASKALPDPIIARTRAALSDFYGEKVSPVLA